jgi:hypothetical protein
VTDPRREQSSIAAGCDGVTASEVEFGEDAEFGERAAIREYDGGCSRAEAERLARAEIGETQTRH